MRRKRAFYIGINMINCLKVDDARELMVESPATVSVDKLTVSIVTI